MATLEEAWGCVKTRSQKNKGSQVAEPLFSIQERTPSPKKRIRVPDTEYNNERKLAVFKVKGRSENSPAYEGRAQVDGEKYVVNLWERTSKKGLQYLSGTLKRW